MTRAFPVTLPIDTYRVSVEDKGSKRCQQTNIVVNAVCTRLTWDAKFC